MGRCLICSTHSDSISEVLGVCLNCIREKPKRALKHAAAVHRRSRLPFGLPPQPVNDPQGISCRICEHRCRIPEGGMGYCGIRKNQGGTLIGTSIDWGNLSWYHDPLPTNCVADWVCAGGTGAGHPRYAHTAGAERGFKNLAVFFQACNLNCLYCQNWHFRNHTQEGAKVSRTELTAAVDERTSCLCFFGGDPTPQLSFALKVSHSALEKKTGEILRTGRCMKGSWIKWWPCP